MAVFVNCFSQSLCPRPHSLSLQLSWLAHVAKFLHLESQVFGATNGDMKMCFIDVLRSESMSQPAHVRNPYSQ